MIIDGLRVLWMGMAGIFIVMGIIALTLTVLNRFSKANKD